MSLQQAVHPRSSANGYSHRRVEKELGPKTESKMHPGKLSSSRITGINNSGICGVEGSSKDRLVYFTTCLIGHHVEVQVKNGSVYSGIFHATSADNDFGIVLKMARLIKDTSFRGQKTASDSFNKAPSKTLIMPAHDLVQIIAKDVPVTRDGLTNELQAEKQQDLMIDSYISKSHRSELERELERWVPDEDVPQCTELDNIFDSPWTGSWDQFKVNETLFGVKSTFDEELYTTRLERGPQTRRLEEAATRIAREIEGEETHDLHLAGERGIYPHGSLDIDEETLFSSVIRGTDDSGLIDEDVTLDTHNDETFGSTPGPSSSKPFPDVTGRMTHDDGQLLQSSSSMDESLSTQFNSIRELFHSGSLEAEHCSRGTHSLEEERSLENQVSGAAGASLVKEFADGKTLREHLNRTNAHGSQAPVGDVSDKVGNADTFAPSDVSVKAQGKASSPSEPSEAPPAKGHGIPPSKYSHGRSASSASSTTEGAHATSAFTLPGLSPSSSVGSLSSEKSTLNPNAKEFRLNPNAKSFVPTQSPVRPVSPVSDGSYYYPTSVAATPHMHGMPVGIGMGASFSGPQPMIFNPQAAPMQVPPQGYFPPNTPQYGQQMIVGHQRQVLYMPGYPPEMQFKGREF